MIHAIDTRYRGFLFRSRLEARWAVFFDALPVPVEWEYEKEGYALEGTWYLPDFYLPQYSLWIEIKGQSPTEAEQQKALLFSVKTKMPIVVFHGLPTEHAGLLYCFPTSGGDDRSPYTVTLGGLPLSDSLLDILPYKLVFESRGSRKQTIFTGTNGQHGFHVITLPAEVSTRWPGQPTLRAVDAAKSARFEHGSSK